MTDAGYEAAYAAWQRDPQGWWEARAGLIDWDRRWDRVFAPELGTAGQWFAGGVLNTAHNCLDRHVAAGRGEQIALICDSAMTDRVDHITYRALRDRCAKLAGALAARGVGRGDRVVIYMPMVASAVVAMLACARLGAIHSVVFGGFAAAELASRIADAKPRAVLSASCGLEPGRVVPYKPLLDAAIALSPHKPDFCLIEQREALQAELVAGRDFDFAEAEAAGAPHDCVPVAATDPLYILYTSGTTGRPKGLVRDNGGHAVALANSMRMVYGVETGEAFWAASDIGWVVGHSYIVYGPLLAGCTSILYEGKPVGTPDAGAYWRVCAQHGVRAFFTAPTGLRAVKQADPEGAHIARHDLSKLRTLFLAGSGAIRRRRSGSRRSSESRWWIIGGRPRRHGRSRPVLRGSDCFRSSRVPRDGLHRDLIFGHSMRRDTNCRAGRREISWCGCRCHRDARRRCGRTMRVFIVPTSRIFRGGIAPAMRARSTRTATCG